MTVSTTVTRVTYTGDGSTTAFSTTFSFFDAPELEVIERVIATGVETVKTLTTDYTVSGGNGSTGTVTAVSAPASTVKWVIRRKTARTQEIDYTPNDPFPAETHEEGLDRLKMNVQELGEENDRSLKFPKTDSTSLSSTLPSSVERAGKFLTFNGDGELTVSAGSADSVTVSPFAATLLDDADADAFLTTLGPLCTVGTFTRDVSLTGSQAITGVGFQPSAVIFIAGENATSRMSIGADNATTKGIVADRYGETANAYSAATTASISAITDGSNIGFASIASMDSDGFTLTWSKTGSPTGTVTVTYIALRG